MGCKEQVTYTWAAGGEGGGWYKVAREFSRLLNKNDPKVTINVIPGGGIENPVSLDQGDVEIAWGVGYVNRAAYNGIAPLFRKKHKNLMSVAGTLAVDYYHFLAARDQGITTIEQLAEKIKSGEKINLAAAAAGTTDYVMASIMLNYYGASFDMIRENGGVFTQVAYRDMSNMFLNGEVDYAVVNLGMPGAMGAVTIITEMTVGRLSVLLAAPNELIDYCHTTWRTVSRSTGLTMIPGGTYPGIDNDVPAVCHSTEILVSPNLPEDFVYTFTKTLNENKDFLIQLGTSYSVFDPGGAAAKSVQVPLHPGAVKYYREAGVIK